MDPISDDAFGWGRALAAFGTDSEPWMRWARCTSADPDLFTEPSNRHRVAQAKAICETCPAARQCLDLALEFEDGEGAGMRFGIFGGLTGGERAEIAAERARQAAA